MKKYTLITLVLSALVGGLLLLLPKTTYKITTLNDIRSGFNLEKTYPKNYYVSPSPTPRPLTFEEMNKLYGPCAYVPTIFYHHIEGLNQAKTEGHQYLAVAPDVFRSQMQYLKDKGYNTISMQQLIDFFDSATRLPAKSILITFDDGYGDFATNAAPVLQSLGLTSTMFLPTGLVGNPGYLTWDQISGIQGAGNILFANHTWSHKSMTVTMDIVQTEITTADTQLSQRGLGNPKVFAYPYGTATGNAISVLNQLGYKLAFTTVPGSTLCKAQRLTLPRIRIGNSSLSAYGF